MGSLTEISAILQGFSEDRPSLKNNNTLESLQNLLRMEMVEFEESPDPTELADIIIFAISIGNLMGWNMDEEIRNKIAYNHARYPAKDFQEGDYEAARLRGKSREEWVEPMFYE